MTISTTTARNTYNGSGTTGPFAFTWKIFAAADLRVVKRSSSGAETVLAYPTDYSVAGVGDGSGGSITLTTALAVGETLVIRRLPSLVQPTALRNQGTYFPATLEDQLDRLLMQVQGIQDDVDRAVKVQESRDPSVLSMAAVVPQAGRVLGWSSSTKLESVAVDAGAVSLPGDGRTVDSTSAFLANNAVFNVLDYGAIGDGVTNDRNAIQAALDALPATGGVVRFPKGAYVINSQVLIGQDGTQLVFDSGATIVATIPAADVTLINSDSKDNVVVDGLNVDGAFPWAVYISGGSGHRIRNCRIRGGTVASSGICGGIRVQDCSDVQIIGNDIAECGNASLDAGADIQCNLGDIIVDDILIAFNECHSTEVIENICGFNLHHGRIIGNRCSGARVFASSTGTGGYGILCYGTAGINVDNVGTVLIDGNQVADTEGNGIYTQDRMKRITIVNNDVSGACTTMTEGSLLVAGIVCEGEDSIVANNRVIDSGKNGIATSTHAGIVIRGNTIVDPAEDGITVTTQDDVLIQGNLIRGVGTGKLAIGHRGFVDRVNDGIVIENNVMLDCTHAIHLGPSATNCIARDNVSTGLTDTGYIAHVQGAGAIVERNIGNGRLPDVPSVASAATIALPFGPDVVTVTGTTNITSITATGHTARRVTLVFTGILTFTDGSNLKLNANFVTSADDTITLVCDGTNWFEVCRSAN
jgi:hypothetical protein